MLHGSVCAKALVLGDSKRALAAQLRLVRIAAVKFMFNNFCACSKLKRDIAASKPTLYNTRRTYGKRHGKNRKGLRPKPLAPPASNDVNPFVFYGRDIFESAPILYAVFLKPVRIFLPHCI